KAGAARRIELLLVDLGRDRCRGSAHAAPGQTEVEQAVVRDALPVPAQSLEIGQIDRLGRRMGLRRSVGEAGAAAGLLQREQVRGGELGPADVVAPSGDEGE